MLSLLISGYDYHAGYSTNLQINKRARLKNDLDIHTVQEFPAVSTEVPGLKYKPLALRAYNYFTMPC